MAESNADEILQRDVQVALDSNRGMVERDVCNLNIRQQVMDELTEHTGKEYAPDTVFCPTLLGAVTQTYGADGLMHPYVLIALENDLSLPDGTGAAAHMLHFLHRGIADPANREAVSRPPESVTEASGQDTPSATGTLSGALKHRSINRTHSRQL